MWHGRVSTKVARRRMEKNCLGDQRSPMGVQGLISPKIFQCRVLSAWADIERQYVDIIEDNILIEIILQAVC